MLSREDVTQPYRTDSRMSEAVDSQICEVVSAIARDRDRALAPTTYLHRDV